MSLKLAIIADDLTGALDTATPFVEAGLSVAVAITPEHLDEAINSGADVVAVNTASRALDADDAARRVVAVAEILRQSRPDVLFKKIDSRLKGNVAAESRAAAVAAGFLRIVVAPAIPDQQRFTVAGTVTGRGVETPLSIAALFEDGKAGIDIADAQTDADLDALVASTDWAAALAVGARGLGAAFARHFARPAAAGRRFLPPTRVLFAFGSRDPITAAQIGALVDAGIVAAPVDAPAGLLPPDPVAALPAVLRCTGELIQFPQAVVDRFAEGVRGVVADTTPDLLMMGGGDTALAVLTELGAGVLMPAGEIEAGIPWFEITDASGRRMSCAVKSGGFGNPDSLLRVLAVNDGMTMPRACGKDL
ncbi:MAG: four-carbon acid sugar kinase family protein [Allorhizobium sp.]